MGLNSLFGLLLICNVTEFYEELRNPFSPHKKPLKGEYCCEKMIKLSFSTSFVSRVQLNLNE